MISLREESIDRINFILILEFLRVNKHVGSMCENHLSLAEKERETNVRPYFGCFGL